MTLVSYELCFLCCTLSLIVGASTIITFEKVHPGCVQRQREPFGCCMKNLMWFLLDITNSLSLLGVVCLYVLMSCSMIVCLPAALCLLRFVTCILSLIDVQLTKYLVLCKAKDPIRWNPATPRAIQRKAHIREIRSKKHARRLLSRCLKQISNSHGPWVAWFFKPGVYPSFCKALVLLRILSWSCHVVTSCYTTCVLCEYNRIYASIFYACCVLVLPLLPTGSDIFRGSLALAAARCHTKSVDAHFDTQSARGHGTSAATGHGTSTATGHRISAATGHRTSTATGQWQRAKNVSGHGSCRGSP